MRRPPAAGAPGQGAPTLAALLRAPIRSVERRPSPRASSAALEELDVVLADGRRRPLVLKDLAADRGKPAFLQDPERELVAYGLLAGRALGTATCHGRLRDRRGRSWLVLERVAGPTLAEAGAEEPWRAAAAWLGRFHAGDGPPPAPAQAARLVRHDRARLARWAGRARAFAGDDPARRARVDWLVRRHAAVAERLAALPPTLVHGEFYALNVVAGAGRVCPVDWELMGLGPAALDVAALVAGDWEPAQREALRRAYLAELPPGTPGARTPDELRETVALAGIHLCVQWLGWRRGWRAPDDQRRDWLGEGIRLCEEVGL